MVWSSFPLPGNISWQHPLLQMNCKNSLGNCCKTRSPNLSCCISCRIFWIPSWTLLHLLGSWSSPQSARNRLAASRQHEASCHTICNPCEWIQTCADLDSTTFALLLPFSATGSCKCRPVEFTRSCTAWRNTTDNSAKQSGWTWSQSHTIVYTKRECLWLWEQNISRTSQWSEILTHENWTCNKVPHPHDEFILSTCSFWGDLTEACTQNHKEIAMVHFRPVIQELADIYQHVWKWNVSPKTDCVSARKLNV